MRQIILDTETTGLSAEQGHRIIEVGCVELINRKLTGKYYHQYINPLRPIEEGAVAVHGLTTQFLQDKPVFQDVVNEFMEFVADAELIIHNAPFDVSFINAELRLLNQHWTHIAQYCRIVDTLALARQLHIGQRNSLDALCKRYTIDNSHRELHGALLDAHLLARVYLAMTGGQATLFSAEGSESITHQQINTQKLVTRNRPLKVIKASSDELASHEKSLQEIEKKAECLWSS